MFYTFNSCLDIWTTFFCFCAKPKTIVSQKQSVILCCMSSTWHVICAFLSILPYTGLNLNGGSHPQALGRLRRDVFAGYFISVQAQRQQFGETGDVHKTAETTKGELWNQKKKKRISWMAISEKCYIIFI